VTVICQSDTSKSCRSIGTFYVKSTCMGKTLTHGIEVLAGSRGARHHPSLCAETVGFSSPMSAGEQCRASRTRAELPGQKQSSQDKCSARRTNAVFPGQMQSSLDKRRAPRTNAELPGQMQSSPDICRAPRTNAELQGQMQSSQDKCMSAAAGVLASVACSKFQKAERKGGSNGR
jgi:hypothetical protein